jgi:hypothetical protein
MFPQRGDSPLPIYNFAPEAMILRIFDQKSFPEYNAKIMDIL